jgi:hypothetical protein
MFLLFALSLQVWANVWTHQLMTAHPHDMKAVAPYILNMESQGRLVKITLKKPLPSHLAKFVRPLTGEEKHFIPKVLKKKKKDPGVDQYIQLLVKENIQETITKLAAFPSRAAGSADNQTAMNQMGEKLRELGYTITQECYQADACSVVAEKKGQKKENSVLILLAHLDSVGRDQAGADDNASGVGVLMEIARVLATYPNQRTIRFFITNGEELGLLGCEHYVNKLQTQSEINNIYFTLNMDMVGYNSNKIVELETDAPYTSLAQWMAELVAQYTNLTSKITIGAWGSDHVPFLRKNISSILTIEDWSTKTPCYHQTCDKPNTINFDYAYEISKLNTAAMILKDQEQ